MLERICLEGFQSGLSWRTVLERREHLRQAFDGFDPMLITRYARSDVERLLADPRVIRNGAKIAAVIDNARALLSLQAREGVGALDALVWSCHVPQRGRPRTSAEVPSRTDASTALARDLRRLGFRYVGPTTAYSVLQATGVVDDHLLGCEGAPGR